MSPSKPAFSELSVLSTLAMKGVLDAVASGLRVQFHATQALLKAIADGESADVVLLTDEGIAQLAQQGKLVRASEIKLGASGVGLAVRAGAPKPDISSLDALKKTLLAAQSVAHSRMGASGIYFAGLLERLGLAERLKKRVIVEKGPVAAVVASGGAEIGAQLLCELAPVPGIDIVGPLPAEVQNFSHFSAALMRDGKEARAFLEFLRSPRVRDEMRKNFVQP